MNYHYIFHITRYEIRMLWRDWGMRLVVLLFSAGVVCFHLMAQSNIVKPQWVAISTPSAIPFANAWFVNYLLLFVAIFWVGRFMQKSPDSDSSIQIRPFSNTDYLYGKTLGFMAVAFSLVLLWMVMAVFIHLFVSDSPFSIRPYFYYALTLTLPALIFVTGFVTCIKGMIPHRALLLVVLPGLFFLLLTYGARFLYGATDIFASRFPNLFSDVVGFSGEKVYLLHRSVFLLLGCGMLVLGVYGIKRLPDRRRFHHGAICAGMLILLAGFVATAMYVTHFTDEIQARKELRQIFSDYRHHPKVRITDHDIIFRQGGDTCEVSGRLTLYNPSAHPLSSILLYLNPDLILTAVSTAGRPVNFSRQQQAIVLDCSIEPQQTIRIDIRYHGTIAPEICYAEIDDLRKASESHDYYFFRPGKEFFYLTPDFTLLTPECLWYPVALPPVDVEAPYATIQSYTRFTLTVVGEKERLPISQGERSVRGDSVRFVPEQQLPGLSLCIGNYTRKSFMASATLPFESRFMGVPAVPGEQLASNGILYELYLFKGHEYLTDGFKEPQELADYWQEDFRPGVYEYNYRKLALIETPLHFCAYSRSWKKSSEYIQPEMIFRPEREAFTPFAFKVEEPEAPSDVAPHMECFFGYMCNNYGTIRTRGNNSLFTFIPVKQQSIQRLKNEYDLSGLLQSDHYFVSSSEFPGIDIFFREIQASADYVLQSFRDMYTPETAIEYLSNHRLAQVFTDLPDDHKLEQIIQLAGSSFISHLLAMIPYPEWSRLNKAFLTRHAFQEFSYETYAAEFLVSTGIDILQLTRQYYNNCQLPVFLVREPRILRIERPGEEVGYIQSVKVWNRGKSEGVITLAGLHFRPNIHCLIPAGACKEIRHYFPGHPDEFNLEVQTNRAQNIPAYYSFARLQPEETAMHLQTGIFDADTLLFLPLQDEYIVDDRDSGFRMIDSGQKLKKELTGRTEWKCRYEAEAYGEPVKSYLSKTAGTGNIKVEWNVSLPVSGEYELFIYNDDFRIRYVPGRLIINGEEIVMKDPLQTYYFAHAEGNEEITLDVKYEADGWVSLGKYPFEAGPAKVTLTDKGADQYQTILADAVKWVYLGK